MAPWMKPNGNPAAAVAANMITTKIPMRLQFMFGECIAGGDGSKPARPEEDLMHADPKKTRRYAHLSPADLRAAVAVLDVARVDTSVDTPADRGSEGARN